MRNLRYTSFNSQLLLTPTSRGMRIVKDEFLVNRSEMKLSTVSPPGCDTRRLFEFLYASSIVLRVSLTVPIWFSFISIAFPTHFWMPFVNISLLVQNRSSPTISIFFPSFVVILYQESSCSLAFQVIFLQHTILFYSSLFRSFIL